MTDTQKMLQEALSDPARALDELNKLDAQDHLRPFINQTWHELEPGIKMVSGWAVDAVCEHLEWAEPGREGGIKKLLINVPPGCMKSMTTSVFWPAWLWGPRNRPDLRVISTSYAADLAIRDNGRCRNLINSETYQHHWGDRFHWAADQNAKSRYENNHMGFRQSASTGSALTGHRGDVIIVDDPHSVQSSESEAERKAALMWFGETLPTRFNNQKEGVMVVIMQRLHEEDISGLILEKELGFEHLMLPMEFEPERKCIIEMTGFEDPRTEDGELLWPERFAKEEVEDLKETFRAVGGEYAVAGQMQQSPVPRGGGMFQKDDFQFIDRLPDDVISTVRGWDLAATKDGHGAQTAGVKMHKCRSGLIVISDSVCGRWGPTEVRTMIQNTAKQDGHGVHQDLPQDPGQAGKAQKSDIGKYLIGYDFSFSPESGSKEDRARPLAAQGGAGNIAIVRGPWNDAFINECCIFPNGKLKDQVDAASRGFAWLVMNEPADVGAGPELF